MWYILATKIIIIINVVVAVVTPPFSSLFFGISAVWYPVTYMHCDICKVNIWFSKPLFTIAVLNLHDEVIKWNHFPCYWPFVRGINRSPVNSLHKGQWRGTLMFSLIWMWINGWINNREAGDLRPLWRHCNDFSKHRNICVFLSFLNTRMTQVVDFLPGERQRPIRPK